MQENLIECNCHFRLSLNCNKGLVTDKLSAKSCLNFQVIYHILQLQNFCFVRRVKSNKFKLLINSITYFRQRNLSDTKYEVLN